MVKMLDVILTKIIDGIEHVESLVTAGNQNTEGIARVEINEATGEVRFYNHDNTVQSIEVFRYAIEGDPHFDTDTMEFVATRRNGSELRVSIADIIKTYQGSTGDHIQITTEDNTIEARIINGTIGREQLTDELDNMIPSESELQPIYDRLTARGW